MSLKKKIFFILVACIILCLFPTVAIAQKDINTVVGNVYTFDKKSDYEISGNKNYKTSDKIDTYGNFSVSSEEGVPSYEVKTGSLKLFYTYEDSMLKESTKEWYLVEDKNKEVDGKNLNEKILKGAIIIQISKDRKNWSDISCTTDAFNKTPIQTEAIYETTDVEILNGCYYKVTVVYQTKKLIGTKQVLFITNQEYEEKKTAEVYEFYACSPDSKNNQASSKAHKLGDKVRTAEFGGYYGESEILDADPHFGWDLGQFYVDGYTKFTTDPDTKKQVFLKNVGDKVTLGFNLAQNIDKLDGKDNLKITADLDGYDAYFETKHLKFGRGVLIIRYTDYKGNKSEPQIYTNYLEANTKIGADTIVQLCEEGDYEVALDYEVTDTKGIDKKGHYRIYFEFSVRNGNCMVYPFDVVTGTELTNGSLTENGFRIDMANSRYLSINIKKEILAEGANGLVEDTRFNRPAKDGEEYTDEGIYTITVENKYTKPNTTKKIYVGTNKILKAHVATGFSIPEINNMLANGATISDDGMITLATNTETETTTENNIYNNQQRDNTFDIVVFIIPVIIVIGISVWFVIKRKRQSSIDTQRAEEGGVVER